MQQAIGQTLAAGQQVLVFLNRRGFAPTCCATTAAGCPNASAAMRA
jgi:primosomal protein N' (replication factor Y)